MSQAPDLQVSPSREKEEWAGPEPKERLISCPQALPRSALNPHNPPDGRRLISLPARLSDLLACADELDFPISVEI